MTKNRHFLETLWNVGVPDRILTSVTAATGSAPSFWLPATRLGLLTTELCKFAATELWATLTVPSSQPGVPSA